MMYLLYICQVCCFHCCRFLLTGVLYFGLYLVGWDVRRVVQKMVKLLDDDTGQSYIDYGGNFVNDSTNETLDLN